MAMPWKVVFALALLLPGGFVLVLGLWLKRALHGWLRRNHAPIGPGA
jgi:hypothetical protein